MDKKFLVTDIKEPEEDRFKDAAREVKKAFHPEWLEEENSIFMNNLNYVTRNFKVVFDDVAKLKQQVYTDNQRVSDEQELKIRQNSEEIY